MSNTLALAKDLISQDSTTPEDAGCQALMRDRLEAIGFSTHDQNYEEVINFWARKGDVAPLLVFAGHTDVVPTGPVDEWDTPPFEPTIRDGLLYGRGAADMKGSLAAMITACEAFVKDHPDHKGSIGFLITSDEEGPSVNGTVKVVEWLEKNNEKMDWCLVGEPSSTKQLGDVIKNGRRGSLNGRLTVHGKQGHVAYPHLATNPFHVAAPMLAELIALEWDAGNDFFPPTSFQIANLNCGTGAENVIPGKLELQFNLRYSTELTEAMIRKRIHELMDTHKLDYEINWRLSGEPFLTPAGALVDAAKQAIKEIKGFDTDLSTSGGTSDGRFIAPTGAQVLELGPLNATIHQINECVSVQDLDDLSRMYQRMMELLLL